MTKQILNLLHSNVWKTPFSLTLMNHVKTKWRWFSASSRKIWIATPGTIPLCLSIWWFCLLLFWENLLSNLPCSDCCFLFCQLCLVLYEKVGFQKLETEKKLWCSYCKWNQWFQFSKLQSRTVSQSVHNVWFWFNFRMLQTKWFLHFEIKYIFLHLIPFLHSPLFSTAQVVFFVGLQEWEKPRSVKAIFLNVLYVWIRFQRYQFFSFFCKFKDNSMFPLKSSRMGLFPWEIFVMLNQMLVDLFSQEYNLQISFQDLVAIFLTNPEFDDWRKLLSIRCICHGNSIWNRVSFLISIFHFFCNVGFILHFNMMFRKEWPLQHTTTRIRIIFMTQRTCLMMGSSAIPLAETTENMESCPHFFGCIDTVDETRDLIKVIKRKNCQRQTTQLSFRDLQH